MVLEGELLTDDDDDWNPLRYKRVSPDAEVVYLQWNSGWGNWEQVVDEAAGKPGVVAFRRLTPKGT